MNSNQRTDTGGGINTSSLTNEEKMNLFNSLDEKEQLRFFESLQSYRNSGIKSVGVEAAAAGPKKATTFASDDESSNDDDDQGHGFVKKDLVLSSVPFMGQDHKVIAFCVDNSKTSQTTTGKYYNEKWLFSIFDNDRKNYSILVSNGNTKEAAHWKGLTDANKFPRFLLEEICGGEFVELSKKTTSRIYNVMEKFGGRGQYESREGNIIFGCNDVNGVADDLFGSGRITMEMRGELMNIQSDANKKLFYFIDTVNHTIAFVFNYHGCHYSKTDPGKVARVLINGYASERRRKYNK